MPIPFPSPAHIPIVGQPCKVHGWFPTVLLSCSCEAKTPLMIVGLGAVAQCEACKRGFSISGLLHDAATGAGSVSVGLAMPPAPPIDLDRKPS